MRNFVKESLQWFIKKTENLKKLDIWGTIFLMYTIQILVVIK